MVNGLLKRVAMVLFIAILQPIMCVAGRPCEHDYLTIKNGTGAPIDVKVLGNLTSETADATTVRKIEPEAKEWWCMDSFSRIKVRSRSDKMRPQSDADKDGFVFPNENWSKGSTWWWIDTFSATVRWSDSAKNFVLEGRTSE